MSALWPAVSSSCGLNNRAIRAQPKMLKIQLEKFAEINLENFAEIYLKIFAEIRLNNFADIHLEKNSEFF